jgi:UDP-N-acetylglucosamine 2-epimerase (non-hydrolysing)
MSKSSKRRPLLVILGTRAELIKIAPILRLLRDVHQIDLEVLTTGQHSAPAMVGAAEDLQVPVPIQTSEFGWRDWERNSKMRLMSVVDSAYGILAVGDTNSARIAIEVASLRGAVGIHVEAGLRLSQVEEPEEYNRRLMARLATWHLVPFEAQRSNLLSDSVDSEYIKVVGELSAASLAYRINLLGSLSHRFSADDPFVLFTLHRWSNIRRLNDVIRFLEHQIRQLPPSWRFVAVRRSDTRLEVLYERLVELGCVMVDEKRPLAFLELLMRCSAVLTDSAGVQQEAVLLGKPCGVLRSGVELYRDALQLTLDVEEELSMRRLIAPAGVLADVDESADEWFDLAEKPAGAIVEILEA